MYPQYWVSSIGGTYHIYEGVFLSPLLLYNVAMNIFQQIFSYHYEEIKKPLT